VNILYFIFWCAIFGQSWAVVAAPLAFRNAHAFLLVMTAAPAPTPLSDTLEAVHHRSGAIAAVIDNHVSDNIRRFL
jgi:hypothetical protein